MKIPARTLDPADRKHQSTTSPVHFEYIDAHADSVCLAGTFNDWHPNATPLTQTGPGEWKADLQLAPGRYEYVLIVDGCWRLDPHREEKVENPFGGLNSVLTVPARAKDAPRWIRVRHPVEHARRRRKLPANERLSL